MADWGAFNQNISGMGDAFGKYAMQKQEMQDKMQLLFAQEKLKQAIANQSIQERMQMFGEEGLGVGNNLQQPLPPQQPVMSLGSGGQGDILERPVFNNPPQQAVNRPNKFSAPEGFRINPNFIFGGTDNPFVEDKNYVTPKQQSLNKQRDVLNSTRIRQEFINRPEVKDYITVAPNIRAMESLLENALQGNIDNSVALDQGLITMFNKLTDPQSVVRESEYARTPGNLPFINRFNGAIQKVRMGGAGMTDDDRRALVQGAKIIANERGAQYQTALEDYKGLAVEYDLDEKLITRGMKDFEKHDTNENAIGGAISLPKEITTTSQAVGYLMNSNNMTEEEAINWIRSQ